MKPLSSRNGERMRLPRRMLLVTPDYPPDRIGGVGNHAEIIALQMRRAGIEVVVAALTEATAESCRDEPGKGGATFYRRRGSPAVTNWHALRVLRRRRQEYDLIHCLDNTIVAGGLIGRLRRRPPIVASLNNLQAACPNPEWDLLHDCRRCSVFGSLRCAWTAQSGAGKLKAALYMWPGFLVARRLARGCDHYIAISEDIRRRYIRAGIAADRITTIPRWMDDRFYAQVEGVAPAEKRDDRLRVLFAGQLGSRKGPQDLLEAYIALPAELREQWELVILGRGPLEGPLRARADEAGLGDRVQVRFCPYERLPAEYAAADIFAHPARWPEPAGATRLEAMAFSLPILSSENPSAREIMGDDGALYYRAFDVDHLREQLAELMRSPELRERLGRAGHARLENHRTERVVARFLEVYGRVLAERESGGA